jgi:hypothetical protein
MIQDLPNELIIEILLTTTNEKQLMNICSISKNIYNLCKEESVAKHIMKNIIQIKKPNIFKTYSGFLKHYIQLANTLHKDFMKQDSINFYRNFDYIMQQRRKKNPNRYP